MFQQNLKMAFLSLCACCLAALPGNPARAQANTNMVFQNKTDADIKELNIGYPNGGFLYKQDCTDVLGGTALRKGESRKFALRRTPGEAVVAYVVWANGNVAPRGTPIVVGDPRGLEMLASDFQGPMVAQRVIIFGKSLQGVVNFKAIYKVLRR